MTTNRTINLAVGWAFIMLGIAGFILPILQGFLFLIVGLLFLSKEYHWAHRLLEWLKKKVRRFFPKTGDVFDRAEAYLEKEIHKIATEKGYLLKRLWIIITFIIALALVGWGLTILFGWLIDLVFG